MKQINYERESKRLKYLNYSKGFIKYSDYNIEEYNPNKKKNINCI